MTTMLAKTIDLSGQTIGEWKILEFVGYSKTPGSRAREAQWLCECNCGKRQVNFAKTLLQVKKKSKGGSSRCKDCATLRQRILIEGRIPYYYWNNLERNAKKRDIEFSVTSEECYSLLEKQDFKCALSGFPIRLSIYASEHLAGKTTASLDRIDSNVGYISSNIQWIHKDINMMKHTFDMEYFINICQAITNYRSLP